MKNILCVMFLLLLAAASAAAQTRPGVPNEAPPLGAVFGSTRVRIAPEAQARALRYGRLEQAGMAAARAQDYGDAVLDLRRATAVHWTLLESELDAELGTALDHLGKRDEAFMNYRKAFGLPVSPTLSITHEGPEMVEALARYGTLCEARGLRADAVQCFNKALLGDAGVLYGSLDPQTASPALVQALLEDVRGAAFDWAGHFGPDRSAEAMTAFQKARRLAPRDPRPSLFLADGLRHAGRFAEAAAAVQTVSRLDRTGGLALWAEHSRTAIQGRQRE